LPEYRKAAKAEIASLGNDALELELARVTIDGLAVIHFEVVDVVDVGRGLCQQVLQCLLAFDQWRAAQVVSVEIEQIESEVDQAIGVPVRQLAA
jgi:hypothetical protein